MALRKKKPVQEPVQEETEYRIRGRIIDAENGMRFLPEVAAVRIRSEEYVLLVMEDYLPTLGQIDGSISFLVPGEEVTFNNIHGFYKHQHNEFTLLIDGVAQLERAAQS